MDHPLDFQSIILTLQHFWANQGCLIWQPYYLQVGAGTMNPATSLRVLGPEPWKVAYVEPSIRPDDGRYGENPNRMQLHYQFQVILKPDPGNPQEVYLRSLETLGIDPSKHDIRFVEDNWEQPALGSWGLGWEVWLDGQEITQFTYFQQSGGFVLDPVSVEITYGLDRIAIALQRVLGFTEIRWNEVVTSGDLNLVGEQEHSKYYFEVADVERMRKLYDLFEIEGEAALKQNLVLPAYDYLLKCSHTFNIMDTRGAIGVTERQAFFARMRDLSRRVAEAYLEQRQRLEYPLLSPSSSGTIAGEQDQPNSGRAITNLEEPIPGNAAPFLLEIGTEELPVGDLKDAIVQLQQSFPALLNDLRLEHGKVEIMGTPRRLVVFVEDLAIRQSDVEQVVKGPPAQRAYDSLGQPTKAAEGFARSKGLNISDLEVREMDGGNYVIAFVHEKGSFTTKVLSERLPGLIAAMRFNKSMRWNSSNVTFSRPIRWLLALYGDRLVPFEYAGLKSTNLTRGLRFFEPREFTIRNPGEYFSTLAEQGIQLEMSERQETIENQVKALSSAVDGEITADADLLVEVSNLVEAPIGLLGSFDPSHLELPQEVLISVMKKHQRYFPVERGGDLLPYFIAVANKSDKAMQLPEGSTQAEGLDLVIEGNEHVIRARFADAAFFVNDDMKRPLEEHLPKLDSLAFQEDLGSMLDKTHRIQGLVEDLSGQMELDSQEAVLVKRAAQLCKADLVTKMVIEMTSLQGVMGRYYAIQSGEPTEVGTAIFEHHLPRYAGDKIPETRLGLVLGIADRLDTLAGLFAVGLAPTGAKDPFALRRAALGLVNNLIAWDIDFDLRTALVAAANRLPVEMSSKSLEDCLTFIVERLRNAMLEEGHRYDVVEAILADQGSNPASAVRGVKSLGKWVKRSDWNAILPAYARCVRITRDQDDRFQVDERSLVQAEERALYTALVQAESIVRQPGAVDDFFEAFLPMIPAINRFFDEVLVMTEEKHLQENRLGLLQRIARLTGGVADLSKLEGF
jgi:glycyl-tRNA synthetase